MLTKYTAENMIIEKMAIFSNFESRISLRKSNEKKNIGFELNTVTNELIDSLPELLVVWRTHVLFHDWYPCLHWQMLKHSASGQFAQSKATRQSSFKAFPLKEKKNIKFNRKMLNSIEKC